MPDYRQSPKPLRFRKLRIAWSVVWGVLILLLIIFWVRSRANYFDQCFFRAGKTFEITSHTGCVWFGFMQMDGTAFLARSWKATEAAAKKYDQMPKFRFMEPTSSGWGYCVFAAPHWFILIVFLAIAALPWWIRWRFSLRTLLISMTLVALALGLIIATNR